METLTIQELQKISNDYSEGDMFCVVTEYNRNPMDKHDLMILCRKMMIIDEETDCSYLLFNITQDYLSKHWFNGNIFRYLKPIVVRKVLIEKKFRHFK
jgi:hypothetical protein